MIRTLCSEFLTQHGQQILKRYRAHQNSGGELLLPHKWNPLHARTRAKGVSIEEEILEDEFVFADAPCRRTLQLLL